LLHELVAQIALGRAPFGLAVIAAATAVVVVLGATAVSTATPTQVASFHDGQLHVRRLDEDGADIIAKAAEVRNDQLATKRAPDEPNGGGVRLLQQQLAEHLRGQLRLRCHAWERRPQVGTRQLIHHGR